MIRCTNLSLEIGGKSLLHPLSLELEAQKLHLILGPNGAGKSTLVKLLSGQVKPSSGSVFYNQIKLSQYKIEELAKFRAVLSQSVDFAFPVDVKDVVMMGRYPHFSSHPKKADRQIVAEAIDMFEIAAFANRDYTTLSGGEKQRVQFARIMAQIWPEDEVPRILFLDEPLTYLDVKYQYDFLNKVRGFLASQNLTVVGVLHDLNLAARFADNLILLHNGELITEGSKEEVLTTEHIETAYEMTPKLLQSGERMMIDF